jgi:putative mRNA 3-end processing factor
MPITPAAATARYGRRHETLAIMEARYGPQNGNPVDYGERLTMGDVDIRFVPAGHVLGSAQIVLEHRGERIVVSGDYKRREDPTCAPFEPVPCDVFITEATFGLPVFRHPETHDELDKLLAACAPIPIAACWSAPMRWARRSG